MRLYRNQKSNLPKSGFGISVIQRLVKTSVKKNLYYEIKDRVFEERYQNGMKLPPLKQQVREYGTNSTKEVRARLIEILFERVDHHKDKFIAPILHSELETMETKKNGKVEHADGSHDDQIFSYLMALRVWYDGINLVENFGLRKNTLKTDDDEEIECVDLEGAEYEPIEVDNEIVDDVEEDELGIKEAVQYLEIASKFINYCDFIKMQQEQDANMLQIMLNGNKEIREAYEKQFHMEHTENTLNGMNYVQLPDYMFDIDAEDVDIERAEQVQRYGNMYDIFSHL